MGQGQVSDQSGTSLYPVITATSYKVAVLVMSILNYVTHQYTNTTQNKFWQGSAISDCSFSCYCCARWGFVIQFPLVKQQY